MKIFILLPVFFLITSFTQNADAYICKSTGAKKYHLKENCRGLSNCKAEIGKVKLSDAKGQGKTLCGWED